MKAQTSYHTLFYTYTIVQWYNSPDRAIYNKQIYRQLGLQDNGKGNEEEEEGEEGEEEEDDDDDDDDNDSKVAILIDKF
jgi:hypothetical protein